VVRRTVSLLMPIPVLGLSVGLTRFIGFSNGKGDSEAASRFYGASLWCIGIATLVCVLALNFMRGSFAFLLFGNRAYGWLVPPMSLMIAGLCVHTIVCGYFRGHLDMNKANLLQLLNLAALPPLLFLFFHNSLQEILNLTGGLWIATAGIALLFTPIQSATATTFSDVKSLLRFGVQRVPGDFMMMALLTLPVTFLAHLEGIKRAGYLAFAMSVLTMIGAIFAPVGLVLLPKATFMFAGGSHDELRRHVLWILKITLVVCAILTLAFFFLAPALIGLYLGPGYGQVIKFARIVVIAAVPYSLYLVLRNLIDAFHENGVTTAILGCSLGIFVAGVGLGKLIGHTNEFVVPAFLSAVFALMLLSALECIRIFRRRKTSA
jgi:O-antigen/teichoic acid export membrane protein